MIYNPSIFETNKDIEMFIKNFEMEWPEYFSKYSRFYNIATEAIKDYMPHMGENFNTVLTVGASGDQGIELARNGANNIYFFDINRADYYYLMLKKVAVENLKRKDFLDYIVSTKQSDIMDYRIYTKIKDSLPNQVKLFWDYIYKYFNYNNELIAYYIFRSSKQHSKYSKYVNEYYSNNNTYYDTQNKIKNSNWHFIESDFYKLDKTLPTDISFDAIVLSNIYEYINFGEDVSIEKAKEYIEYIKKVLIPRLNESGTCMCAYLCKYNDEVDNFIKEKLKNGQKDWAKSADFISNLDNIEKYFTGYTGQNVSYHYLLDEMNKSIPYTKVLTANTGYGMSNANNDMALIYKK